MPLEIAAVLEPRTFYNKINYGTITFISFHSHAEWRYISSSHDHSPLYLHCYKHLKRSLSGEI